MIQFKRGNSKNWSIQTAPLADGQPGFDKTRKKLKIGDGKTSWKKLPFVSGLFEKEVLDSETSAKKRSPVEGTLITFGTEPPDKATVGQVYLQHFDGDPEVDYVVSTGVNGIWCYQKWHSGIAKCWGTLTVTTNIQNTFEESSLYYNNKDIKQVAYPFTFKGTPVETATLQSPGWITWTASTALNTNKKSAAYTIISPSKQSNAAYRISLQVEGFWK